MSRYIQVNVTSIDQYSIIESQVGINMQGKQSISLNNSLNKTTNSHSDLKIVLDNTRSYPQDRKYDDNLKRNKTISTIMNSKHYKYISWAQNNNLGAIFSTIMLFWCRLEKRNEKSILDPKSKPQTLERQL